MNTLYVLLATFLLQSDYHGVRLEGVRLLKAHGPEVPWLIAGVAATHPDPEVRGWCRHVHDRVWEDYADRYLRPGLIWPPTPAAYSYDETTGLTTVTDFLSPDLREWVDWASWGRGFDPDERPSIMATAFKTTWPAGVLTRGELAQRFACRVQTLRLLTSGADPDSIRATLLPFALADRDGPIAYVRLLPHSRNPDVARLIWRLR